MQPVRRTGHQSRVKEQVSYLSQEQVTDFGWNLSENSFLYVSLMVLKPLLYWLQVTTTLDLTLSRQTRGLMLKGTQTTEAVSSLYNQYIHTFLNLLKASQDSTMVRHCTVSH